MSAPAVHSSSQAKRLVHAVKHGCVDTEVRAAPIPDFLRSLVNSPLPRLTRAVLFDVYGTLVSSTSGEVGSVADRATVDHFIRGWEFAGLGSLESGVAERVRTLFFERIRAEHARLRGLLDEPMPYPHPEVDIREVWKRVVSAVWAGSRACSDEQIEILAASYEATINPVTPMPDAQWAIKSVSSSLPVGIVSNAQFYTRFVFPACLGETMEELGFDLAACTFSFVHRRAKPDPLLFRGPLAYLQARGIDSTEVLYVGNDMRNDIAAANAAGCMTALFAGDERSLKTREDDPDTRGVLPTTVVHSLRSLVGLVMPEKERS